jgi:hypothetical protein
MTDITSAANVSETMAAPLGDLIAAVGRGLAEAQQGLDQKTIETLRALYDGRDDTLNLMRQLGWQPTWYRIPELSAEITLSLTIAGTAAGAPGRISLYVSPLDASYTNRYDYRLEAASVIRFKIVPVPPSSEMTDRKIVPAVENRSLAEVRQLLASLGIPFTLSGSVAPREDAPVRQIRPPAGSLLAPGQAVELEIFTQDTTALPR